MNWYELLACFSAWDVSGECGTAFRAWDFGRRFPTPFAHPPGKGLSAATVNVVWALFNLAAGYGLFRAGRVESGGGAALAIFFAGVAAISVMMSVRFAGKDAK